MGYTVSEEHDSIDTMLLPRGCLGAEGPERPVRRKETAACPVAPTGGGRGGWQKEVQGLLIRGRGRANRSVCGVTSGGFTTHNDTLSRDGKGLSTTLGFGSS